MADYFPEALELTLRFEGGFVDDPDDRGGATNKGITQAVYDARRKASGLPLRSVRSLEDDEMQNIYRHGYWDAVPCSGQSRAVAMALFDIAVNHGVSRAKAWLKQVGPDPARLIARRREFYAAIVKTNPSQAKFAKGWENRCRILAKAVALS